MCYASEFEATVEPGIVAVGHMRNKIAITQRVSIIPEYGERRDCLDQAWTKFLGACGLIPVLLPNIKEAALALCEEVEDRRA